MENNTENHTYMHISIERHILTSCVQACWQGKSKTKEMEKKLKNFFLYIDRLYVDEDEEEGKILFTVKIYMMLISFSNIL